MMILGLLISVFRMASFAFCFSFALYLFETGHLERTSSSKVANFQTNGYLR